jgi:hypothetical protein
MSTLLNVKNAMVPVFDGTQEGFSIWLLRFQTFAKTYKFRRVLTATPEADLPPTEEEVATDTDDQKAARQRNDDAVYCKRWNRLSLWHSHSRLLSHAEVRHPVR